MRRVAAVLAGLVVVVSAVACSGDDQTPTVAERPTTTNPALANDLEPTVAPPPPAEVIDALDAMPDASSA